MLLINPYRFSSDFPEDTDATAYIAAVESADGQSLESAVKTAINNFVAGCKADGIWGAIKSSCILAGARTLSGALVPLVGTAPTNFNFVSADYNRETGLIGNSSTKYLKSNRAVNADPQNNVHLSVYQTVASSSTKVLAGARVNSPYFATMAVTSGVQYYIRLNNGSPTISNQPSGGNSVGLFVATRSSSSSYTTKSGTGSPVTVNVASGSPPALNNFIFAVNESGNPAFFHGARISFYSIGEALNASKISSRVSTLMTALAAAIP